MNTTQRKITLAASAVAIFTTLGSLPARADTASDTRAQVERATATVGSFADNPDYAALPALLGKAKGVIVFPRIIEGGFILGGAARNALAK